MNERIKSVRAALGLSTRVFGERIGVSSGAISLIETGKRNVSSQIEKAVCREFGVNELWLRTGEGEMFSPMDAIDETVLIADYYTDSETDDELKDFLRKLTLLVKGMDKEEKRVVRDLLLRMKEQ